MSTSKLHRVKARKEHRCNTCDRLRIKPGEVYLRGAVFPGGEFGQEKIMTFRECGFCAERYDRYLDLMPVPAEQDHAIYLNAMQNGRG